MRIEFRRDPLKALRGMQRAKAEDIFAALDRIAADPLRAIKSHCAVYRADIEQGLAIGGCHTCSTEAPR
jgi:hypothetical protein